MVEDEDILNVTLDVLQFTEELKKSPLQNVDSFIMCFFSLDSPYISSHVFILITPSFEQVWNSYIHLLL